MTPRARPAVALALVALPAAGWGDPVPATVRLAWVRGADADACPDGAWLRDEVTRRLRRDPFDDEGPRSIEAVVDRTEGGWRAVLRVRDRWGALLGERTLTREGDRCEPIVEASALAVALAVDPDAVIDETPRPTTPAPRPARRPRRPIAPPPPPAPSMTVAFGAQGGVAFGLTPSAAPVVGFGVAVELSPVWSLRGHADLAPSLASDDPHFAFGFTRLVGLGCVDPVSGTFGVSLCLGGSGAVIHAAARDVYAREAGDRIWLGATAAARVQWNPSRRFFVGLRADLSVAVLRASFQFSPDGSAIYEQPVASGGGAVEVGLRAP